VPCTELTGRIALADGSYREPEKAMLAKIARGLGIDHADAAENKLLKFRSGERM